MKESPNEIVPVTPVPPVAPVANPPYVRNQGFRRPPVKVELHKINEKITADPIRLVGENVEPGIVSLREAIELSEEFGLDLVEISPKADPPVCRIIDYNKFLYEQKKKAKEIKANSVKVEIKEIRFGPNTDEHDFNFKKVHAEKFLEEGSKVRAYVFFKGRSILFKEKGELLLLKFAQELAEQGKVEQLPTLEGKKMQMLIAPKAKK